MSGIVSRGLSAFALVGCLMQSASAATVKAFAGRPFGVGSIVVQILDAPPDQRPLLHPDVRSIHLTEAGGRVFYPTFLVNSEIRPHDQPVQAASVEALFRFQGTDELKLTLHIAGRDPVTAKFTPLSDKTQPDVNGFEELEQQWWRTYSENARKHAVADEYPPQIENYLTMLWARRLRTQPPSLQNPWSGNQQIDRVLGLLMGAESVRVAMQRDTFLGKTSRGLTADHALPSPTRTPPVPLPEIPDDIPIEAIAKHVPEDCFYVRFGSFANFRWMRSTLKKWGGTTRNLVAVRGIDYHVSENMERQLGLRETPLSQLFGDTVISDVAFIGTDPFFREGAAWGILFEARNSTLLGSQLSKLRGDVLKSTPQAKQQAVEIENRQVSFLSTPDNRVRSFYVVDGDYHLVTTSREIARRFLAVADGRTALGQLAEFRFARHKMPLAKDQTVFAYLSDPFFRQIIGPQYRVEMTRRMLALAEIELVELARLAAKSEGGKSDSIDDLIRGNIVDNDKAEVSRAGYLPRDFKIRPDASQTVIENGVVLDSLRGARGSFLPVVDVDVARITASERDAYEQFKFAYERQWQRMDPVIIALTRKPVPKTTHDRLTIDVHITPYARRHYEDLLRHLRPPGPLRVAPVPSDLATVDGHIKYWFLNGYGFAGLRDHAPELKIKNGRADLKSMTPGSLPAYFAMITPTNYPMLEANSDGPAIMAKSSFSTQPYGKPAEWQADVIKSLKLVETPRPVQLGLRIHDLNGRQITRSLDTLGYLQGRRTSSSNTRFMAELADQLKVSPPDAFTVAERILGGTPVCPLNGNYALGTPKNGSREWRSTAWVKASYLDEQAPPADYTFPFLRWFHGLDLEFNIDATSISSRIELVVER